MRQTTRRASITQQHMSQSRDTCTRLPGALFSVQRVIVSVTRAFCRDRFAEGTLTYHVVRALDVALWFVNVRCIPSKQGGRSKIRDDMLHQIECLSVPLTCQQLIFSCQARLRSVVPGLICVTLSQVQFGSRPRIAILAQGLKTQGLKLRLRA